MHGLGLCPTTLLGKVQYETRSFGVDPLDCPQPGCSGRKKLIASIMKADAIKAILDALGLPSEALFISPSRGPPGMVLVDWA